MRPPFKTHGGKHYLKQWIISEFPENYESMVYGELYVGGGSVFLAKKRSRVELINDMDPRVFSIWFELSKNPREFIQKLGNVSHSKKNFEMAYDIQDKLIRENDYMNLAISEYILRRMSRGADRKTFGTSNRSRGGNPEYLNAWLTSITNLHHVIKRVQQVKVECKPAIDLMYEYDSANTLFYLDPPYLHGTRVTKNNYEFEMTQEDHGILLEVIKNLRAKVLLSGYWSKFYEENLKGWHVSKQTIVNHSSQQKTKPKKVEYLWKNFG